MLAAGWLCMACGGGRSHAGATPASMQVSGVDSVVQGTVAVKGADPFAQVIVSPTAVVAAREVAVVGPLRAELGALSGAEVRVRGRAVSNGQPVPRRAIAVTSYEIVSINGEKPIVGELVAREGDLWLGGERLSGVPAELHQAVGAKLWVVGRRANGELLVLSYGIIVRPPK